MINDESSDETSQIMQQSRLSALTQIHSKRLPQGWTGKLWAQHQGVKNNNTPLTLLLEADIALAPNMIATLKNKLQTEQ